MTFNLIGILCRERQGKKGTEQRKKRLELGKAKDSLGFLFETPFTSLAGKE